MSAHSHGNCELCDEIERWLEAKCTIAGCWKTKYEELLKEKERKE